MLLSTLVTVGIYYAGSSMTKGAGSPANIFVFFKMMPEKIMFANPTKINAWRNHERRRIKRLQTKLNDVVTLRRRE